MGRLLIKSVKSIKSNQMLVFEEREKPEYPEKNLSELRVENQQTRLGRPPWRAHASIDGPAKMWIFFAKSLAELALG